MRCLPAEVSVAPKGLSKSRRVTGRVLARNDRAALDLTRRPPRKGDVVHCLHYNPDGSYDDWFAGSVKRVEDHNKITIKFDDGSADWAREPIGSNDIIYGDEVPLGCPRHK
jgi:hypothetical protein